METLKYYRRFLLDMTEHLKPLNNLLNKGGRVIVVLLMENNIRKCMGRLKVK